MILLHGRPRPGLEGGDARRTATGLIAGEGGTRRAPAGPHFTNADGTPKYQAAFFDDFYDDLGVGTERIWSVRAIFPSPVVDGTVVDAGSSDGNLSALNLERTAR
jgi:hypothetical protein